MESKEEKIEEKEKKEKVEAVGTAEKTEKEAEEKKEKIVKKEKVRKEKAIVNGRDLGISTKHSMAICKFIRGRKIENVVPELEKIINMKKALPMKGEIPHRKGMERGRYPINACKVFVQLLKSLNANCQVNGIEYPCIAVAKADRASRPHRRFGGRFKRTNVYLEAREIKAKETKK